jgi:hypothetical protein
MHSNFDQTLCISIRLHAVCLRPLSHVWQTCFFTFINDYASSRSNRWYRWALAHLLFTLSASDMIARIIFACR